MRVGLNFALQSPRLKVVLLRVFLFFMQSTALLALLPLVARDMHGGGPATFTVMLACLGAGAAALEHAMSGLDFTAAAEEVLARGIGRLATSESLPDTALLLYPVRLGTTVHGVVAVSMSITTWTCSGIANDGCLVLAPEVVASSVIGFKNKIAVTGKKLCS